MRTACDGGVRVTVALADFVGSATLVAITLTVCSVVTTLGAVYRPAALTVPTAGLSDQVTAVFDVFVTVAVKAWLCPPPRLTAVGVTWTAMDAAASTICMALTLGRLAAPVLNWIVMVPAAAFTVKVLSTARNPPPASA